MSARWLTADVFDGLATLDDGSVDLVVTSPPFLALRSYLPSDHPDKGKEIGSEATPAEFIDVMLRVTAELRRVLAPHGSICIELGDTYAGTNPKGVLGAEVWSGVDALGGGRGNHKTGGDGWPMDKSRTLIPEAYRFALAYGTNPLTGQPSPAGRWRVRNVVTWARPNPPVGALGDKWRPATSDVVVACTSNKRYWDDLATRKAASPNTHARSATPRHDLPSQQRDGNWSTLAQIDSDPAADAPLLDYWEIPPGGYQGSHYAVFPPELVVPLVKAMCPQKVCLECGEPSRRIHEHLGRRRFRRPPEPDEFGEFMQAAMESSGVSVSALAVHLGVTEWMIRHYRGETNSPQLPSVDRWPDICDIVTFPRHIAESMEIVDAEYETEDRGNRNIPERLSGGPLNGDRPKVVATGWTDCGHDNYRPGIVLDPFAGSGTTLAVATGHGLDAIGIDLDPRNEELARERVGPLLFSVGVGVSGEGE